MKVDSLRSHVAIVVTLLLSASCFVKTANEKHVYEKWKNKEWQKMRRELYSLTRALGRSAELPVNSQVCRLHWDEIRRQNNRCSCSKQINFERVITESTPNENEQHKQYKLETGNGRSQRMRRRFAAVLMDDRFPPEVKVYF